jgi:hypothetical protein
MKTSKTYRYSKHHSLIIGLILTCITGILLFFINKDTTISELDEGLFFIVGLTTMGALSAFNQYAGSQSDRDRIEKSIDKKKNNLEQEVTNAIQIIKKNQQIFQIPEEVIQSLDLAVQKVSLSKDSFKEIETSKEEKEKEKVS